jgi:single-stranded-DNA-specific exonuclease
MQRSKIWQLRRPTESSNPQLQCLKKNYGELLGAALWSRGFGPESQDRIQNYLNPRLEKLTPPWGLKNIHRVVERLILAFKNKETVCVYADYDMDGMSGMCLLKSFLEACGFEKVHYYQPHRFDEGYGVHPEALREIHQRGAQLIITVDTGITAFSAATTCRDLGIDLIITDHHQQVGELPQTPYIINPNQKGDTSGLGYLSGSGVAFYVCMALRQRMREEALFLPPHNEPDLREWLDIFSLGTIGDVVDLVESNRILIRSGVTYLARSKRPGLRALLENVLEADSIATLTARDVAYSVIPKLNAASRMGKAQLSTQLLLCERPEEAENLVHEILQLNTLRSATQAKIFEEARRQADAILSENPHKQILCLVGQSWHEGVLGIVAAKIVEHYARPAIVLTQTEKGKLRGSMRSRMGFHCVQILEKAATHLERFGGHQAAAGMQLESARLPKFCEELDQAMLELYADSQHSDEKTFFDAELSNASPLNLSEVQKMLSMEPFGAGNPEPVFLMRKVPQDAFEFFRDTHIKVKHYLGVDMIGFQQARSLEKIIASGAHSVDLLVTPEINTFRNQMKVQLRIQDLRESVQDEA